ncbi:conserved hypothetical protein [delta proteobacterium NaphS2]|nr:conserved hypothetical protein [delta proteobacterium NaphS2]
MAMDSKEDFVKLIRKDYITISDALNELNTVKIRIEAVARVLDDKSMLDKAHWDISQDDCWALGYFLLGACRDLEKIEKAAERLGNHLPPGFAKQQEP